MSSVYFWDLDDGFAGVVLLKKSKFDWESIIFKSDVNMCSYPNREE